MNNEWISVKDKFPQFLLNVIVFYDNNIDGYISRGFYDNGDWYVMSYNGTIHPKVTHWMHLPDKPKV